ncbi:MAG TPA: aspartyl protease family protein [Solirubrobacteraceae bacterium]|nr:aspartyl protease family protein [Solirubrobacteraceae bacterium]
MIDAENNTPEPPGSDSEGLRRALRRRFIVALLLAGLGAFVASGFARSPRAQAGAAPGAVSRAAVPVASGHVPIAVVGSFDGPPGAIPTVSVRIGNGPPARVVLDTGSSGVWIQARYLPRGVPVTGFTNTSQWGDGNVTHETLTTATLSVGGVTTTRPVPVAVVHSIGCQAIIACAPWAGSANGAVGILGISPLGNGISPSPLLALPAPYSASWRISLHGHGGALQLGVPDPTHPLATLRIPTPVVPGTTTLQPAPSTVPASEFNGAAATACWQLGRRPTTTCLPTLFDTGSANTGGYTASGFGGGAAPALRPGVRISVRQTPASPPFWRFTSGTAMSRNIVQTPGGPPAYMIAGIPAFYAFAITFDASHNALLLASPSATR